MNILIIEKPCYIYLEDKYNLHIKINEKDYYYHFDTIEAVVIESDRSTITIKAINALMDNDTTIFTCDERFLPKASFLSLKAHNHPYKNLKKQIELSKEEKARIWDLILRQKITNQKLLLEYLSCEQDRIDRITRLEDKIMFNDPNNVEGVVEKLYDRQLFGTTYMRYADNVINACLNFGYALLASMISRWLVGYGYATHIGINHHSQYNNWNLTYDLIEPFRQIIDYFVASRIDVLGNTLTKDLKAELVSLLNAEILYNGITRKLKGVIRDYVGTFNAAITTKDFTKFKIPVLKKIDDWHGEV